MNIRRSFGEKLGTLIIHGIMIVYTICCIYPFLLTFIVSISTEKSVVTKGYVLFPDGFTLSAYQLVFKDSSIFKAYGVTLFVTAVGTLISLMITGMAAYAMSLARLKYRNVFAMFFFIPMVFSAGLVPWYLICVQVLHFKNSLLALIMPGLMSPFNLFLMRNFFKTIPDSLVESAEIDGSGVLNTFIKIIIPVSTPIIATICLFVSLGYWNDWTNALWFMDNKNLYPLQFFLYRIKALFEMIRMNGGVTGVQPPDQTFQMATLFVTIGPIIFIYPFVQKYFAKGIMVGAVKG